MSTLASDDTTLQAQTSAAAASMNPLAAGPQKKSQGKELTNLNHSSFSQDAASVQRGTALRRAVSVLALAVLMGLLLLLSVPRSVAAASLTACTPLATLPADVSNPNAAFDTAAHVITTFNFARQQEGCTVSLSIDPTAYNNATPQMQVLLLLNAERQDRGLGALQLDSTLL